MKDKLNLIGNVKMIVTRGNGEVEEYNFKNRVVSTGTDYVAQRMASDLSTIMSHMALGSDDTAPVDADTILGTELGRVILDDTTVADSDVTYQATFPQGTATGAVVEAGIFNDASVGAMLARTVFPVINKGESDSITMIWRIRSLPGS